MIFCCVSVSSNQRDALDPLDPARGRWIVPIPFNASNPSPRRPHALDMQSKTTCSPSPSPAGPWSGRSNVRRGWISISTSCSRSRQCSRRFPIDICPSPTLVARQISARVRAEHGPWFWHRRGFFRSVSRKHGPGFHCPAKLYVPKNARPALPRLWARLDPTALPLSRLDDGIQPVAPSNTLDKPNPVNKSTPAHASCPASGVSHGPRKGARVSVVCAQNRHAPRHSQPVQASWARRTTAPAPQHLSQHLTIPLCPSSCDRGSSPP